EFVGASSGGRLERDHVKWSLGTIAPGASRTVQVTVKASKAGTFRNVSTATGDRGLSEQGKADTRFDLPTGLSLEIEQSEEPLPAGQATAWTLRLMNRGKSNETQVGAIVRLPEGVTAEDVRGIAGAQIQDGKILVPALAALTPGRDEVAMIRLKADKVG